MNAADFVDAIRSEVLKSSADGTISLLQRPPGRKPALELVSLSQWFNALPEVDKERVREVAVMSSHGAVFGFLAVLDGVRAIEDGADRGSLELRHIKGEDSTLLNDPSGPLLHDLLNQT